MFCPQISQIWLYLRTRRMIKSKKYLITKWCFIEYTTEDIIFLKAQLHIYRNAMIISDRDRKGHYTQLA